MHQALGGTFIEMFPLPLFRTFVSPLPQYVTSHPQKVGAPSCLLCRTGPDPTSGRGRIKRKPDAVGVHKRTYNKCRLATSHGAFTRLSKNKRIFTLLHGHIPEWIPNGHRRCPSRGGAQASFNGVTHAKKGMGKKKHLPYVAFQYGCRPIPDPLPRKDGIAVCRRQPAAERRGL